MQLTTMGSDDDGKVFMGTFCLSADFTGWGDGFDGGLWGEITLIALILRWRWRWPSVNRIHITNSYSRKQAL